MIQSSFRALIAILGSAVLAASAGAVDILVTTNADSGAGSLREAFTNAVDGDVIVFDITGPSTITLASDLPTVAVNISFSNNQATPVTIDRNGFAALDFTGGLVNPTVLVVNTFGATSPDADIITTAGTTVFGNGDVTGNLDVPGTLAPGADANPGTIGTFNVTGNLNTAGAEVQLDISANGATTSSDLITVDGVADVSGAALAPNFMGSGFAAGQTFLVLDSTNPISGAFSNAGDSFALPENPFLKAVQDTSLSADDFGLLIQDNGLPFATVVMGCNQVSAATVMDQMLASGSPPTAITSLRSGSTDQVSLAVNQLSGSIYPSLIGAEINHIQNNLESVRDRAVEQFVAPPGNRAWLAWMRAYGVSGEVSEDNCLTPGYRHEIAGAEIGLGVNPGGAVSAYTFAHLAGGNLTVFGVDHYSNIDSYRVGGLVEYLGDHAYLVAAGGGGVQNYSVRRFLTAFEGSDFALSRFDGSSQFGYFEIGSSYIRKCKPYLALHATRVELDPITETGDADYALINNGGAGDSLRSVLGMSVIESALSPLGVVTTRLRFGWLHEYLDAPQTIMSQVAFSGASLDPLADRGVDEGTDWGFLRTQVDWFAMLGGQFTLAYEGQFNTNASYNALLGGIRWIY